MILGVHHPALAVPDMKQALDWLERAYEEHSWSLIFLRGRVPFELDGVPMRNNAVACSVFVVEPLRRNPKGRGPRPEFWSVADILTKSSNVGTTLWAQELGGDRLDSYLREFGFGETTALEFVGETLVVGRGAAGLSFFETDGLARCGSPRAPGSASDH